MIDEIKIYRRALSASEILSAYNSVDSIVDGISPSGRNGGYVASAITNLTISFKQPIDTSAYNFTNVTVDGQMGLRLPIGLRELCDRTYEFSFEPPLTEDGPYHFAISPTLRGIDGTPLDINLNGTPGGPEDSFGFTLILDTRPPHVAQHAPSRDVAGTVTSVDVWFSEPIDKTTFKAPDILFTNTLGQTIPVARIEEAGLNRFRLTFAPQTTAAMYSMSLGSGVRDLAGNPIDFQTSDDVTFNLVPVDLELSSLSTSTNHFQVSDLVNVSWEGRNVTGAPLLGNWVDALYLSPDPFWNISDVLLGTVIHTNGLASNEVYSASLEFRVPGLLPGNYYLIVRADIANQTRETAETNNSLAYGPVPLTVRQLTVGDGFSGAFTAGNRFQYFAITLSGGESLRLRLDGQSGINYLFVNYASIPSRFIADASGTTANPSQTVVLTGIPGGGTYYVLVSSEQPSASGTYALKAETAPFFVTDFSPPLLVGGASERFWVQTLQSNLPAAILTGVGFDDSTTVAFVGTNTAPLPAVGKEFVSPSMLRLMLPIRDWPAGAYSLTVTKGAVTRVLTNALTVVGGGDAKLDARIIGTALSPGGGQTLYVEYANTGTRPMPTPLLKITAYKNSVITTYRLNRRPQDRFNRLVNFNASASGTGGSGSGVLAISSYRFRIAVPLSTAQVMAVGQGQNPGILQPGERGRVPVYFDGLLSDHGEGAIEFSVGSLTADDTSIINCGSPAPGVPDEIHFPRHGRRLAGSIEDPATHCPDVPFSPDWTMLEEASVPETEDFAAWHAVWQNVVTGSGPLWADYVLMLGDNMNHLAKINQVTNDPATLFNFEVLQATGALNPVRTLAAAVDASAPSPGFPLVFRRVYRQPILSRYRLGPLGRGWSHNWDIFIQTLVQSQGVVVHGPVGEDRFFGRYSDGSYTATGSDTGQLIVTNGMFRLLETDKTVWQFGASNRLDYLEDPNGNRITCGYSGSRLTSLSHSSGKQLVLDYDSNGRLWHLTDPLGPGENDDRVTTYEYDGSGQHLIRVAAPGNRITTYTYHTTGILQQLHALTTITHPDFTQDSFAYDDRGRLIQTSRNCCGGAQQVTYAYDSAGTVTVTDATGRTTQLLYGLGGQLAQVRDGEGRIVNFTYDDLAQLTQLLGPGGERYRYGYDGAGNLSGIEDPLRQVNNFTYEPNFNRLAQVRDARGNGLQYAYDTRGNLTAITYADNTRELFAYDSRGNVVTSTNRRGGVITYAYNSAGQLTSKDYSTTPGIIDFTYAYDSAGNLTNATYWSPQLSVQEALNLRYDPNTDRLTRIEYPGGRFFTFAYDAAGRRTHRADQDGHATAYLYDALGRLDRMTNELGQVIVNYDYDAAGRLSRKTLGNGVFTIYTYNQAGQVIGLVNLRADSNVLSSFGYTYDASGRRASMTTLAGTDTYGYDPLGQLTSVTYPNSRVVNYAYDAAGNRTQVSDNGVPATYAANTLNQYTSAGAATFGYDLDGNLTNKTESATNTIYTYDIENRLIGVATPTDNWTYTYDAFGNRIAATHNGQTTRYVIDPTGLGNVAAEYDGGGSLIARYEHGFGLLVRTDAAGNPACYTFSAIGHTSELTDPAGAVANTYAYDPFGLSLGKTEAIPNPFQFVGEFGVMNEENGLEFMRERYGIPRLGRFSSEDPLGMWGGSLNYYEYAGNNPVSYIDPSGLGWVGGPGGGILYPPTGPRGFPVPPDPGTFGVIPYPPNPEGGTTGPGKGGQGGGTKPSPSPSPSPSNNSSGGIGGTLGGGGAGTGTGGIPGGVTAPDPDPTHNEDTENSNVVRSRDPNDKLGPSGYGSAGYLPAGGMMDYQIRFENQPSATAPAQRATVTDSFDPNLDLSTFELTEITFANQSLTLPVGLNHYETRLAFTITNQTLLPQTGLTALGSNSIVVDVQAVLDVSTRVLTLTLTALDPNTGWYPEDPFNGLLYPDDDTHRGLGTLSYLVRANPGVPSGTVITNRARIVFDYSDPIDTPLVSNTIDSGPPTSAVDRLPTEAGPAVLVQWSGRDDQDGSGLASFDVFVEVNGINRSPWLERSTATSAWFRAAPGSTYSFFSIARDNVGQEEAAPAKPDATVYVPTNAPVLGSITPRVADVGSLILITNSVSGTPLGAFEFSLGAGSPFGATINPTNGVLRWTPNCAQASRTNIIAVWVTDSANPNLHDTRTITVVTRECVVPELGRLVLRARDSGRVPVNLISSVPMTNLSMTVETDTNRLVNLWLEPLVPEICTNSLVFIGTNVALVDPGLNAGGPVSPGAGLYLISLGTCTNQFLIGTQQVAWLNFTAATGQSSAFVGLRLDNAIGLQPDGEEVRNFAPQSGRTVVVGTEPLLEAVLSSDREPALILYGQPGPGYIIEGKPSWEAPWQVLWQVTQTNLFQQLESPGGTNRMMFFRARRDVGTDARLEVFMSFAQRPSLVLHGQTGVRYRIESKLSLDSAVPWTSAWEGVLSGAQELISVPSTNQSQFFRAVRQ